MQKKVIKTKEIILEKEAKDTKNEYIFQTGRRKTATAKVKLFKNGKGEIKVNNMAIKKFLPENQVEKIQNVFKLIGQEEKLDVKAEVLGGGLTGQAEAIAHGIAKALVILNKNFKKPLKKAGLLTRDSRKKERKKPGLKRARRAPQWQKR